jgi:hypothetical protein
MSTDLAVSAPRLEARTPSAVQRVRALLPATLRDSLHSARQLVAPSLRRGSLEAPLPTGVAAVDRLLCGGLPRGRLVELTGPVSCGRFSTLMSTLSATTRSGDVAALVDLGNGLDVHAAREAGIVLERLLWVRPRCLKDALISCELVLHTGFPLVIVDLGLPPVPGGRGRESGWLRLARAAGARRAALLVSSPYRVCSTAAEAVLTMAGNRTRWLRGDLCVQLLLGSTGQVCLRKSRTTSSGPDSDTYRFATAAGKMLTRTQPSLRSAAPRRRFPAGRTGTRA